MSNTAELSTGESDDECVDLPQLDIDKSSSVTNNGDNSYAVDYTLIVSP